MKSSILFLHDVLFCTIFLQQGFKIFLNFHLNAKFTLLFRQTVLACTVQVILLTRPSRQVWLLCFQGVNRSVWIYIYYMKSLKHFHTWNNNTNAVLRSSLHPAFLMPYNRNFWCSAETSPLDMWLTRRLLLPTYDTSK